MTDWQRIEALMRDGKPRKSREIAAATGLHPRTVLNELRKRLRDGTVELDRPASDRTAAGHWRLVRPAECAGDAPGPQPTVITRRAIQAALCYSTAEAPVATVTLPRAPWEAQQ